MYATFDLPQDPFFMLDNVRAAIAGQQNRIQMLTATPCQSWEDMRIVQSAEIELQRLRTLEESYQTTLLDMPSSSNAFLEPGAFSHAMQPAFRHNDDFTQGASSIPQPFPMDLDIPSIPYPNLNFNPDFIPAGPPLVDSFRSSAPMPMRDMSINNAVGTYASTALPFPTFEDQNTYQGINAARASGSVQFPATLQVASTTSLPLKTDQTYDNPQASSSKSVSNSVQKGIDSEDESSDYSSDDENVPDVADLLNRIGVKAPLPIADHAVDENGDYYGRGRDLFDGPRADHQEFVFPS
jgi:hypothetical protein